MKLNSKFKKARTRHDHLLNQLNDETDAQSDIRTEIILKSNHLSQSKDHNKNDQQNLQAKYHEYERLNQANDLLKLELQNVQKQKAA